MTPPHREPQFTPDELRVLREMIAERQYDQARSRFLGATWKRGRALVVTAAAFAIFGMQVAALYISYLAFVAQQHGVRRP